MHILPEQS